MAIYHWESKVVTRGIGRTACGAAAYMSCSHIYNNYDGIQHDYTRKGGLIWTRVFLPPMAPAEWQDRETLWNAVEANEKAKDSQLAREFIVALPIELNASEQINLLTGFIQSNFVTDGMCADVSLHDTDGHNPHAHILLTMRPLNEDGTWQYKTEKEYLCARDGEERGFTAGEFKTAQAEGWEKQYQYKVGKKKTYMTPSAAEARGLERVSKYPKATRYGRQNPITARWNSTEQIIAWRAAWADAVNLALERTGVEARVDHRSHAERGLDKKPTIHEGASARKLEQMGFVAERCEINRQIREDNRLIRELKALIAKLMKAVRMTLAELAHAMEQARQDIIVFTYGILHNCKLRAEDAKYLNWAEQDYQKYIDARKSIKDKSEQCKELRDELAALSPLDFHKRRELKAEVAKLTAEIAGLREDEQNRMQSFQKKNAAGMKEVKADIEMVQNRVGKMDTADTDLARRIDQSKAEFDRLKEQGADFDQDELTDARLALRPQMEDMAHDRIRRSMKSGKVGFWNYQHSITDTDELLGEAGIAERRRMERQREEHELGQKQPQRRKREHQQER